MFQACLRLIKEAEAPDATLAVRRRCIRRQMVRISGACAATITVLGAIEVGLIYLVMS